MNSYPQVTIQTTYNKQEENKNFLPILVALSIFLLIILVLIAGWIFSNSRNKINKVITQQ
jgi:hypothetical protein